VITGTPTRFCHVEVPSWSDAKIAYDPVDAIAAVSYGTSNRIGTFPGPSIRWTPMTVPAPGPFDWSTRAITATAPPPDRMGVDETRDPVNCAVVPSARAAATGLNVAARATTIAAWAAVRRIERIASSPGGPFVPCGEASLLPVCVDSMNATNHH
jgi:hypothetical protein